MNNERTINGKTFSQLKGELRSAISVEDWDEMDTPKKYNYLTREKVQDKFDEIVGALNYNIEITEPIFNSFNGVPTITRSCKLTIIDDFGNVVASRIGISTVEITMQKGSGEPVSLKEGTNDVKYIKGTGIPNDVGNDDINCERRAIKEAMILFFTPKKPPSNTPKPSNANSSRTTKDKFVDVPVTLCSKATERKSGTQTLFVCDAEFTNASGKLEKRVAVFPLYILEAKANAATAENKSKGNDKVVTAMDIVSSFKNQLSLKITGNLNSYRGEDQIYVNMFSPNK